METQKPKFISMAQLAERLKLPKHFLESHVINGDIPFLVVGKQYRFIEDQVVKALIHLAEREALQRQEPNHE